MPILKEKSGIDPAVNIADEANETSPGLNAHFAGFFNEPWSHRDFRVMSLYSQHPRLIENQKKYYKSYPAASAIELPNAPSSFPAVDFAGVLQRRSSRRKYNGERLPLADLSHLLKLAVGATANGKRWTAPSAGARVPIEIYICAMNVEGLKDGFYHFDRRRHVLEIVKLDLTLRQTLLECGWNNPGIELHHANAMILLTGVFHRTIQKYGHRGWRFVYLDAGHLGENILLTATALGLPCTAYGGGFDSRLGRTLKLNMTVEAPILSYILGQSDD